MKGGWIQDSVTSMGEQEKLAKCTIECTVVSSESGVGISVLIETSEHLCRRDIASAAKFRSPGMYLISRLSY